MISETTKAVTGVAPAGDRTGETSAAPDANANPFFYYKNYSAANAGKVNSWKFQPYIGPNDTVLESGAKGGHMLREIRAAEKVAVEPDRTAHEVCRLNGIPVYGSLAELPAR